VRRCSIVFSFLLEGPAALPDTSTDERNVISLHRNF
jgi:hypothetical protein